MSILQSFNRLGQFIRTGRMWRRDDAHCVASKLRICKFENLEVRNPLTANPFPDIHLGSVYLEPATGDDSSPNIIQISFQGGAPGTQLTQIIINGDKDGNGQYSSGEVFFDTAPGGQGVFGSNPFQVVQANGFTVTGVQVADGGQQLVIDLNNFVAGDKLIFSIDVDEVNFVPSDGSPPDINAVVEGDEFQRSIMTGTFTAPHYQDVTGHALYWDAFDQNFATANTSSGSTLDLPPDSYVPPLTSNDADFTAGAVLELTQTPLPSSISGTVYYDQNLSNSLDPSESGISGVTLTLFQWNGSQYVSTGVTTQTDANGNYTFNNILPGQYCVAETQPSGYFSVGSQPGTVDSTVDGVSMDVDHLCNITLLGGQDGVHYNFGEALPSSISGKVWNDVNNDCVYQQGTDLPLSGVQIDLLDASGQLITSTTTDAQGNYKFDNLAPGTYRVFEHQPAGYSQGMDMVGTVDGQTDGSNPSEDLLSQIVLGSGVAGINYNFCEYIPVSISGKVWNDVNGDCIYEPGTDLPLSGVRIDLLDSHGNQALDDDGHAIFTTTDAQGNYEFDDLDPGVYEVLEHQPAGYEQGMDMVGTVNGQSDGTNPSENLLSQISLTSGQNGIHYDFCEYIPGSISGKVWNDTNGDCVYQPGTDIPLAGVQIDLLDSHGNAVLDDNGHAITTLTDSQGNYEFDDLDPGTYEVFEHQPADYDQGMDMVGTIGSVTVGQVGGVDLLTQIKLTSGANGINYNFCEYIPGSISGKVWNDVNGDCVYQPETDIPLSGVQVDLLDNHGNFITSTTTNAQGNYEFDDLDPGTYEVFEHQPAGYEEGMDMVGTIGGIHVGENSAVDLLSGITIASDAHGVDYNFCEYIPGSIKGRVWNDTNGDCVYQPQTDLPIAGVQIDLLDSHGTVIATTHTDAQGQYEFDDLDPDTYQVFEHQPAGYKQGMDMVGTIGGATVGQIGGLDLLSNITITSGANGIEYDFCEYLPGSISGYVFQDGPPIVLLPGQTLPDVDTIRTGVRTPTDKPIAGVTLALYDEAGNVVLSDSGQPLTAVTDGNGFYQFTDLDDGTYIVREFQPAGYIDGIDTQGSTGGVPINHNTPSTSIPPLPFDPNFDAIVNINLGRGQNSVENNFSEVVVTRQTITPPPPETPPTTIPPLAGETPPPLTPLIIPPYQPQVNYPDLNGGDALGYTWHLSIVDAGYPRGVQGQQVAMNLANVSVEMATWMDMNEVSGELIFIDSDGHTVTRDVTGFKNAIPVVGDFNGDGTAKLGFYVDGQWFIDVNGDGRWDAGDMWARLGTRDDQPVVGDWNGDGKDDIGIYGPAWPLDPQAIRADRGLPSPLNKLEIVGKRKKNIPPEQDEATSGRRDLQRGETGKMRADLIDHVFHYGTAVEKAIVGDWMGTGLRHVGVFRNGKWYLDIDGDGRLTDKDLECEFGQAGDIPVIGDWTGDGIEKIGVYRNGTFYLDTNNNHKLDADDQVIQLGQAGDVPVVGNFDGSGRVHVGVYHTTGSGPVQTAGKVSDSVAR